MALCLGPTGSGKTLLLKKLRGGADTVDDTTTSIKTVGTNLYSVRLRDGRGVVEVRELGGEIASLWPLYLKQAKKIIYVVDASNLCRISVSGVLLGALLALPEARQARLLLALAKMDASYRQMRNEALLMLQMPRLRREMAPQQLTIVECSAITGAGLQDIEEWLAKK